MGLALNCGIAPTVEDLSGMDPVDLKAHGVPDLVGGRMSKCGANPAAKHRETKRGLERAADVERGASGTAAVEHFATVAGAHPGSESELTRSFDQTSAFGVVR
jgi:hypothetical protein